MFMCVRLYVDVWVDGDLSGPAETRLYGYETAPDPGRSNLERRCTGSCLEPGSRCVRLASPLRGASTRMRAL